MNGYVYVEIRRSQADTLANKGIKVKLEPHGSFEVPHTPGLWKHITRPISFSLVVDNFGVKYIDKADVDHLIVALKKTLWNIWKLDRRIILRHHTKVELLQCNTEAICKYLHVRLHHKKIAKIPTCDIKTPATCTISLITKEILHGGTRTNQNRWLKSRKPRRNKLLFSSILYFAISVDANILMSLSKVSIVQFKAKAQTMKNLHQLLHYLGTHPEATIWYYASTWS